MKREVRFAGFDDSPFTFDDDHVRIVGVVTRGAGYVEGVLAGSVDTDGTDATDTLVGLIESSRFAPMLRAVFLNGVTMGGFNIVDLGAFYDRTGIPVVSVVRSEPDQVRSEAALRKHFKDADERVRLLSTLKPVAVSNGRFRVWCVSRGIEPRELSRVLATATVRGAVPEPIRLAHIIASGITRGHSRGPV